MIDQDVRVVDLDARQFRRLLDLLPARAGETGAGLLVIIHDDGRVLKAVLDGRRVPPESVTFRGPEDLPLARVAHGAAWALALRRDALGELLRRAQFATPFDAPFLDQTFILLGAWQRLQGEGVHLDPPLPSRLLALPRPRTLRALLRFLLPAGRTALLYLFENGPDGVQRIATSLVLRQGARGELDFITTDAHLGPQGLRVDRWRSDVERTARLIESRVGRVHVSLFAHFDDLTDLFAEPVTVARFAALLEAGRVVMPHRPLWLRTLLSAVRGRDRAAGLAARWLGGSRGDAEPGSGTRA